jgi:hypothetical protein
MLRSRCGACKGARARICGALLWGAFGQDALQGAPVHVETARRL